MKRAARLSRILSPTSWGGRAGAVVALALAVSACKKAPPPPPTPTTVAQPVQKAPELPTIHCPPQETFIPFLVEPPAETKGEGADKSGKAKAAVAKKPAGGKNPPRTLRTDCVVFAPGRFWLATALSYDEKTGKNPRLGLFSGSPGGRTILFDVAPLPTGPIEKLIAESKEVGVQIRKTRNDQSLVRLGVKGGPGGDKADFREVGLLLQLVAHQPPKILWAGEGDQVTTGPDGCVGEQLVEFELLFRTRLERFNVGRIRPGADGKVPATCQADPSTQDSVSYQPIALGTGRTFGGTAVP